jgi:aspartyl-tRNA(Asn)/glutamyl-tRNA(Gln) amidotransferase subunit A
VAVRTPTIDWEWTAEPGAVLQFIDDISRCTRAVNYLGLPALSVPCGFTADGMPAAFQLVGRPFDEGTLLRAADAYQRETDWHKRIPPAVKLP